MDTTPVKSVETVLTEYDAGMITDGEAAGRLIESAATIPVGILFESIPENLAQRIRSDVSSSDPPFDELIICESDCSLRSAEDIRADRKRKLELTKQGYQNIYQHIHPAG
ncbi:hypothetical protein N9195_00220 [bacterium]|nr:hypothetical protein [bacterium]